MSLSDTPLPPFVDLSFSHLLSVYLSSLLTLMKFNSHTVIIEQFSKNVNKLYTIYAWYRYCYCSRVGTFGTERHFSFVLKLFCLISRFSL